MQQEFEYVAKKLGMDGRRVRGDLRRRRTRPTATTRTSFFLIDAGHAGLQPAGHRQRRSSDDHDRRLRPGQRPGLREHLQAVRTSPRGSRSTAGGPRGRDALILPGVGAFDHAMERLDASGMRERARRRLVLRPAHAGARHLRRHADAGRRQRRGRVARASAGSTGEVRKLRRLGAEAADPAAPHGLERRRAGADRAAVRRARAGRALLLPAFLLLRLRDAARTCWPTTDYGDPLRLRGAARQRLRRAVPPREEPPLGHPAAQELRGAADMLRPRIIPCLLVQRGAW